MTPFQERLNALPPDIREALGLDPYIGHDRHSHADPQPVQRTREDWYGRPVGHLTGGHSKATWGW